uniref:C2H2-type domain-containing protein n=1 Tax=Leptobrachium leishanense TaxID=445787 RepID=A0A8C5MDK3_9ANUR
MIKAKNPLSQSILDLTLEIIYLLTGEDHVVVKKPGGGFAGSSSQRVYEKYYRTQSPTMVPSLIHERNNEQKILELTEQIMRLLTGEVPIRCEDVTVYLSMEEWEYVERYKDLYKDVMMETRQPVITAGAFESSVPLPDLKTKNGTKTYRGGTYQKNNSSGQAGATTHSSGSFLSGEKGNLYANIYPTTGHTTDIKEKSTSWEAGNVVYKPPAHPPTKYMHTAIKEEPASSEGFGTFKCTECGTCVHTKHDLIQHYMIHTGDQPYKCNECGRCFMHASSLAYHKVIHTEEATSKCSESGKCFLIKKEESSPTREKTFTCSECGKHFTQPSNLKAHKVVHTGEKPYKCPDCGKCFTHISSLTTHKRIHTGEKPFVCSECGRCFNRKHRLISHQKLHTRDDHSAAVTMGSFLAPGHAFDAYAHFCSVSGVEIVNRKF